MRGHRRAQKAVCVLLGEAGPQPQAFRRSLGTTTGALLEGANVKLGSVASDVVGVSGQRMLDAIIGGETDAEKLAELALGTLRKNTRPWWKRYAGESVLTTAPCCAC